MFNLSYGLLYRFNAKWQIQKTFAQNIIYKNKFHLI